MRFLSRSVTLLSLLTLLLLMVACANPPDVVPTPTPEQSTSGPNESEGSVAEQIIGNWIVISVQDTPVSTSVVPTLSLTNEGVVSGETGCNGYGGTYTTDGNGIVFAGVTATLVACEDEAIMAQEAALLEALQTTSLYILESDTLTLTDEAGTALMVLSRDA
jgi:heat shock protein HslJ